MRRALIGCRKDRAGMGGEPTCTQTPKHKQPPVMVHTLNDEPYGIQAFYVRAVDGTRTGE